MLSFKDITFLEKNKKARDTQGLFVAEGRKLFLEAPPDRIVQVLMTKRFAAEHPDIEERIPAHADVVADIDEARFYSLSDAKTPQGILTVMKKMEWPAELLLPAPCAGAGKPGAGAGKPGAGTGATAQGRRADAAMQGQRAGTEAGTPGAYAGAGATAQGRRADAAMQGQRAGTEAMMQGQRAGTGAMMQGQHTGAEAGTPGAYAGAGTRLGQAGEDGTLPGNGLEYPLYAILENLQDPGNAGTIIRTGEAAGVTAVFLTEGSVDLYSPKTIRSTMGAIFRVPHFYVPTGAAIADELLIRGVRVYAAHLRGRTSYTDCDYRRGSAFVIGNESRGISDELAEKCSTLIRIPMYGRVESLNAAMAAGILMYEAVRQRRAL